MILERELASNRDISQVYGTYNEWYFESIVRGMIGQGLLSDMTKSPRDSDLDRNGIDYILEYAEAVSMPFQITSTHNYARHRKKNHPDIPAIWLRRETKGIYYKDEVTVEREIFEEVGAYLLRLPTDESGPYDFLGGLE